MKILAIEKELKSEGYTRELLAEESMAVWKLIKLGIVREIYFKKEPKEAVIILECTDESEALRYLRELPLVQNKLIDFEVSELVPYDGFDRILK